MTFHPISCYLGLILLAMDQTINHLDKLNQISSNQFDHFVIIRVLVEWKKKDIDTDIYTKYTSTLKMVKFISLKLKILIKFSIHMKIASKKKSTLFIEYSGHTNK